MYDNSVKGLCHLACDAMDLPFEELEPRHVTIVMRDGRRLKGDDEGLLRINGADIVEIEIAHPASPPDDPIIVEINPIGLLPTPQRLM